MAEVDDCTAERSVLATSARTGNVRSHLRFLSFLTRWPPAGVLDELGMRLVIMFVRRPGGVDDPRGRGIVWITDSDDPERANTPMRPTNWCQIRRLCSRRLEALTFCTSGLRGRSSPCYSPGICPFEKCEGRSTRPTPRDTPPEKSPRPRTVSRAEACLAEAGYANEASESPSATAKE